MLRQHRNVPGVPTDVDYDYHKAQARRLRTEARYRVFGQIALLPTFLLGKCWRLCRHLAEHWQSTWPVRPSPIERYRSTKLPKNRDEPWD